MEVKEKPQKPLELAWRCWFGSHGVSNSILSSVNYGDPKINKMYSKQFFFILKKNVF